MSAESSMQRSTRELFAAAFGEALAKTADTWVVDRIADAVDFHEAHEGDHLFEAGDTVEHVLFLRGGRVRLVHEAHAPWTYEGRWSIGMFDLHRDRRHDRTAIAESDFTVTRLRASALVDVLEDSFEVRRTAVVRGARAVAALEERFDPGSDVPALAVDLPDHPLSPIDVLATMVDVPWLRGAGVQTLADLARDARESRHPAGEEILTRGAPRDRLFVVASGLVEARREAPDVVRRYAPGWIVCGGAALGEPAAAWSARAVVDTRLVSFRIEDWFDRMEDHHDIARAALAEIATQRTRLMNAWGDAEGGLVLT